MKKCIKCNIEKELTEFYRQSNIKYYHSYCKKCHYLSTKKADRRSNVKKWREEQHNGTFKVYTLPNANLYVGFTKAIKPRMYRHKQDGNDYSDYIILHECNTEKEAKYVEACYHKLGFPGNGKKITISI